MSGRLYRVARRIGLQYNKENAHAPAFHSQGLHLMRSTFFFVKGMFVQPFIQISFIKPPCFNARKVFFHGKPPLEIEKVYSLGEAGLFDMFFFLDDLGVLKLFNDLDPKRTELSTNIQSLAVVLIYVMRILVGLALAGPRSRVSALVGNSGNKALFHFFSFRKNITP